MSNDSIVGHRRGVGGGVAFVVCGPSGAGKNSVIERVMDDLPGLAYSVSYTTRARRSGEQDGVDYHYIAHEEFDRLINAGEMVEHVTYLGDQYGTSCAQIHAVFGEGCDVILNIDVNGAKKLKKSGLDEFAVVYIFLSPSSLEILGKRLRERGTESEEQIESRLAVVAEEMRAMPLFDYLVINDNLALAVDELRAIIVAERSRVIASTT